MWAQPIQVQKEQIGVRACSNDFSASQQISPEPSFKAHAYGRSRTKLRSYGAAKRELAPSLDHWPDKGLNNPGRKQPFSISKA